MAYDCLSRIDQRLRLFWRAILAVFNRQKK